MAEVSTDGGSGEDFGEVDIDFVLAAVPLAEAAGVLCLDFKCVDMAPAT